MRSFLSWIYRGNPGLFFEEPHSMRNFYQVFGMAILIGLWKMLHGS